MSCRKRPLEMAWGARVAFIAASALAGIIVRPALAADTLETALGQAYYNNPQLNAQRAAARVTDENVAIALGGYRPRVNATSSLGEVYLDTLSRQVSSSTGATSYSRAVGENAVQTYGATINQTLFNGFQTGNRTRQAESQVFSARELLRTT